MCTVFIMMQKPLALADLGGAWGAHLPPPPLKIIKDEGTRRYDDKCAHILVNS